MKNQPSDRSAGMSEDIAKLAAHTAALLMRYGASAKEAIDQSIAVTGQIPDDELLQAAAKIPGGGVKGKQRPLKNWIRQGAYNPEMSMKGLESQEDLSGDREIVLDSGESPIDDGGVSYYTLDEAILHLLNGLPVRSIIER